MNQWTDHIGEQLSANTPTPTRHESNSAPPLLDYMHPEYGIDCARRALKAIAILERAIAARAALTKSTEGTGSAEGDNRG